MAGNFFQVNFEVCRQIADHGSAELLAAYLILARSQQGNQQGLTTAGGKAIARFLLCSRNRGPLYLEKLKELSWGSTINEVAVVDTEKFNKEKGTNFQTKKGLFETHVLPYPEADMALPNILVEGFEGKEPFLTRILDKGRSAQQRRDMLVLLLGLYRHLDILEYGGIDPITGISDIWDPYDSTNFSNDEEGQDGFLGQLALKDEGPLDFLAVYLTTGRRFGHQLARDCGFWDGPDDATESAKRPAFDALDKLGQLGLVISTPMVFDSSPEDGGRLLYPLWIANQNEREHTIKKYGENAEGLARAAHNAAARANFLDSLEFWNEAAGPDGSTEGGSGVFIFAVPDLGNIVGVIRPKLLPGDEDSIAGLARLSKKADAWYRVFDRIR